jgi:small conductance mechanosensitive channel
MPQSNVAALRIGYLLFYIFLTLGSGAAVSADEKSTAKATTTANQEIPIDELELLLRPLTRTDLETEAHAWLKLLQDKITEISEAEIGAKHKRLELQYADDIQSALDKVEQARQATHSNPDDASAAEALEAAVTAAKTLKQESESVARSMSRDASIERVIAAAEKYAAEQAADNEDEEPVTPKAAEPDSQSAAALDAEGRKLAQDKQAIAKQAEERAQVRNQLLEYINHLRTQQTILIDRSNTVIAAWELKGGDVTEARQYLKAVSGIQVDVTDAEATWKTISGWTTSEEGGIRWLKNFSVFIITLIIFIFLSRLAARGTKKLFAKATNTSQLLEDFMVVSVRRLVIAVGLLVALTTLEVNVGPLLAVIGAAGFVVAFALQDSLGNFASGILILLFRPFDVGDLVNIGGILGKVKSVNLLSVQILTPDNQMVIVPNNNVWSGSITNVTGSDTRRVDLIFGISYDDDIDKAQRIMEDIVNQHERVLKEPEPTVQLHELADSSVNFICRPWVRTEDYWTVYWDVTRAVKQRFDKEGISIPYPQQDVHYHGIAAAVPAIASASNNTSVPAKASNEPAPVDTDDDAQDT